MPYRQYADSNGDTITVYEELGRFSHIPLVHWHTIAELNSQENDVILCSYPKSGTHWMWEIVNMLQKGGSELTTRDMKEHLFFTGDPEEFDQLPSPRVFAAHRRFFELPSDFIVKRRKLVVMVRDPRDLCVSYHQFLQHITVYNYSGNFDGFIDLFLDGNVPLNAWSSWILSYEKGLREHPEIPYILMSYEQLKQTQDDLAFPTLDTAFDITSGPPAMIPYDPFWNETGVVKPNIRHRLTDFCFFGTSGKDPVKEIGRLAEFLGVDPSVSAKVAEQTEFSTMKKFKSNFDMQSMKDIFEGNKANEYVYRKGQSGEWKEYFTVAQESHFTNTLCQQLGRSHIFPLRM